MEGKAFSGIGLLVLVEMVLFFLGILAYRPMLWRRRVWFA